jgi:hypothetical protein
VTELTWVAHAFRVLATVFESPAVAAHPLRHRRELCLPVTSAVCSISPKWAGDEKFVAVKRRDQHAKRVRYPEPPR